MSISFSVFRGVHYKNAFIYHTLTNARLFRSRITRYKIAGDYVKKKSTVLDLCSGPGRLKEFLPSDSKYIGVEASDGFLRHLTKKGHVAIKANLHHEVENVFPKVDVAFMIISLYQFRNSSIDRLLSELKKISNKVIIIEEVSEIPLSANKLRHRIMNLMCTTDYYMPVDLFSKQQFKEILDKHQYKFSQFDSRYCIGLYEK